MTAETLPLGRSLIRLTVEDQPAPAEDDEGERPRRGHHRVAWIERAVEPLRDELDEDTLIQAAREGR